MYYVLWFALGIIVVVPFLLFAQRLSFSIMKKFLGLGLIIVAMIYIVFALLWGDGQWLIIETLGVPVYGLFYWLALRHGAVWLSLGWLLHPAWDLLLHLLGPGVHIVPGWYAIACVSFDLAVAGYILMRIQREKTSLGARGWSVE